MEYQLHASDIVTVLFSSMTRCSSNTTPLQHKADTFDKKKTILIINNLSFYMNTALKDVTLTIINN